MVQEMALMRVQPSTIAAASMAGDMLMK